MPKGSSKGVKNDIMDTIIQGRKLPKNLIMITPPQKVKGKIKLKTEDD